MINGYSGAFLNGYYRSYPITKHQKVVRETSVEASRVPRISLRISLTGLAWRDVRRTIPTWKNMEKKHSFFMWGCPKNRGIPLNHPFLDGNFPDKPSIWPILGNLHVGIYNYK